MDIPKEIEEKIRQDERDRIADWLDSVQKSKLINIDTHKSLLAFYVRKIRKNDLEFKNLYPQE
jgi:hypothetical protein